MDQPKIRRLSADAISRIRGTASLTSLAGAIQELLANSLDAGATSITATVNLPRNSVTVEDDGDGVVPADMASLGIRYKTSKSSFSLVPTFGYRGEFLSSLAASSLLTIYSRNRHHRSTHAVRYHYGSRLICGQVENDALMLRASGTKVIVDRLFGNFPVRVMGRENMNSIDINKEWKDIGRKIVEVLLLYEGASKITIRDDKGARKAVFDLSGMALGKNRWEGIFEQAGYPKSLFESVEAEWDGFSLQGMIGLSPQSDTERQYIFLNGIPISKMTTSILYSKINSLFAVSSFGMVDERAAPADGKRLVVKKGVERHPSFVIFLRTTTESSNVRAEDLEAESGNAVLIDVARLLESVIDEFLRIGGWKRSATTRKSIPEDDIDMMDATPTFQYDRNRMDNTLDPILSSKMKTSNVVRSKRAHEDTSVSTVKRSKPEKQDTRIENRLNNPGRHEEPIETDTPLEVNLTRQAFLYLPDTPSQSRNRISLPPPETTCSSKASSWAKTLLSSFKSPAYATAELTIPGTCTPMEKFSTGKDQGIEKISKESLKSARVISQVDDKYILLFLHSPELLVAVDQHAADERIRLESLWAGYSNEPKQLKRPISFTLSAYEYDMLRQHTQGIKEWGFEFESKIFGEGVRADILGVPELVADRCQTEPLLVVNLIRTWIAELKENGTFKPYPIHGDWIKRMVAATKALGEVVSSRACRSAIMFNDKMSQGECEELISQLSRCDFPFQCAHGRPSMVPLVELANTTSENGNYHTD